MRISNKKLFIDLKYFSSRCHSLALNGEEMANEFRKNNIFSDHGLRLSGLRTSLQTASIGSILCYTRQQRQIPPALLSEDRQNVRTQIRPDHNAARLLRQERLSRKAPANRLLRRKAKQESGFLDKQFHATGTNDHRDLPQTLADRVILQVDQTASANQGVLRHIRECGQNTNMDCYLRLHTGCNYQEAVESGAKSLYNFTDLLQLPKNSLAILDKWVL
jgi:hypothetical protein